MINFLIFVVGIKKNFSQESQILILKFIKCNINKTAQMLRDDDKAAANERTMQETQEEPSPGPDVEAAPPAVGPPMV